MQKKPNMFVLTNLSDTNARFILVVTRFTK